MTAPTSCARAPRHHVIEQSVDDRVGIAIGSGGRHEDEVASAGLDEGDELVGDLVRRAGGGHVVDHLAEVLVVAAAHRPRGALASTVAIGVDVDEHPRVPAEVVEIAPGVRRELLDRPDRRCVPPRRIQVRHPAVAEPHGPPHRRLLPARDDDRRTAGLQGRRVDPHVFECVEAAVVADLLGRPQLAQQLDGLVGPSAAFVDRHVAGTELGGVLTADAHAEDDPAAGERDRGP